MAFPTIRSSIGTDGTTASAAPVVNLPATIRAGDTLFVVFRAALAGTINSWPTGWNEMFDASPDAADDQMAAAWKKADGTEGASITLSSTLAKFGAIAYAVQDAADPEITPPQLSTVATGTSTAPNATTCTPTGGAKDYLWLTFTGREGEATVPPTYPTNYTVSQLTATSGTAGSVGTNVRVSGAVRTNLNAASEDAGAWAFSASDDWTAYTIAFHPAVVLDQLLVGEEGPKVEPCYPKKLYGLGTATAMALSLFVVEEGLPPGGQLTGKAPPPARYAAIGATLPTDDAIPAIRPIDTSSGRPQYVRAAGRTWAIDGIREDAVIEPPFTAPALQSAPARVSLRTSWHPQPLWVDPVGQVATGLPPGRRWQGRGTTESSVLLLLEPAPPGIRWTAGKARQDGYGRTLADPALLLTVLEPPAVPALPIGGQSLTGPVRRLSGIRESATFWYLVDPGAPLPGWALAPGRPASPRPPSLFVRAELLLDAGAAPVLPPGVSLLATLPQLRPVVVAGHGSVPRDVDAPSQVLPASTGTFITPPPRPRPQVILQHVMEPPAAPVPGVATVYLPPPPVPARRAPSATGGLPPPAIAATPLPPGQAGTTRVVRLPVPARDTSFWYLLDTAPLPPGVSMIAPGPVRPRVRPSQGLRAPLLLETPQAPLPIGRAQAAFAWLRPLRLPRVGGSPLPLLTASILPVPPGVPALARPVTRRVGARTSTQDGYRVVAPGALPVGSRSTALPLAGVTHWRPFPLAGTAAFFTINPPDGFLEGAIWQFPALPTSVDFTDVPTTWSFVRGQIDVDGAE